MFKRKVETHIFKQKKMGYENDLYFTESFVNRSVVLMKYYMLWNHIYIFLNGTIFLLIPIPYRDRSIFIKTWGRCKWAGDMDFFINQYAWDIKFS